MTEQNATPQTSQTGGWFAMSRAMFDHPLFEGRMDRVGVWAWMIAKATWRDKRFNTGGATFILKRGQLCVSQTQIADETGMGRQAVRSFLKDLESEKAIVREPANGTTKGRTIITICNYEKYQASDVGSNQAKNQAATKQQPIKEQENKDITLEANASSDAGASEPIEVSILTRSLWAEGRRYLVSRGVAEKQAGAFIGKCRKSNSDAEILTAIEAAQKSGTQNPIPYITETLKGKLNGQSSKGSDRVNAFIAGARGSS